VAPTVLSTYYNRSPPLAGDVESKPITFSTVGPATGQAGGRGQRRNRVAASFGSSGMYCFRVKSWVSICVSVNYRNLGAFEHTPRISFTKIMKCHNTHRWSHCCHIYHCLSGVIVTHRAGCDASSGLVTCKRQVNEMGVEIGRRGSCCEWAFESLRSVASVER
jgi:hypothetical protein